MDGEILIVGAGPTGMTLALQLRAYGVPCRLIEKATERRGGSKALSVNPATLYAFDELGVADRALQAGRPVGRASVLYQGRRLAAVNLRRLAYRHREFLMLPQPKTEEILAERLRELGVKIELGVSFTGLQQTDDGVMVSAIGRDGAEERRTYSYVVGCDGSRSAVRASLGIDFAGFDYPLHFLLADARAEWQGDEAHGLNDGLYVVEDNAFLILLPLTAAYHRVVVKVDGPFDEGGGRQASFEAVQQAVRACVGDRLRLHDPIWTSGAPFYNRLAGSTQSGRVFLAGDAAHLFSPIGGFGMNTGVGDAFNLGWKLAYVMRGLAAPELLRSYESERLSLARRLVFMTDRSTSLIARLTRHERRDEELWLPLARNRPNLRAMPYNLAGFSHSYEATPSGRAGRAVLADCIAPFIDAIRPGDQEREAWRGRHLLVVNAASLETHWPRWGAFLEDLRRDSQAFLQIIVFSDRQPPTPMADGIAWRRDVASLAAVGFPDGGMALVRPDFYVEHVSGAHDQGDELRRHLRARYRSGGTPVGARRDQPPAIAA